MQQPQSHCFFQGTDKYVSLSRDRVDNSYFMVQLQKFEVMNSVAKVGEFWSPSHHSLPQTSFPEHHANTGSSSQ